MTEHTKGLLVTFEVGDNGSLAIGSEDKTSLLTIVEEDGTDFAAIYHAADARRIAACWNACLGLPTDELEQGGGWLPPSATSYSMRRGSEMCCSKH